MKKIMVAVVAVCMAWVFAGSVSANPKIAKESGKKCVDCHTKVGSPELIDAGKAYKKDVLKK